MAALLLNACGNLVENKTDGADNVGFTTTVSGKVITPAQLGGAGEGWETVGIKLALRMLTPNTPVFRRRFCNPHQQIRARRDSNPRHMDSKSIALSS